MLVLTYNFATAIIETTTLKLQTLATKLLLVSSFQNCELKQEASTFTTELQRTHEFNDHEKTKKCILTTAIHYFFKHRQRERRYFFTSAGLDWNCSEIVTSGRIFVLTLNRASALKVERSEQNFLLPQNIVANTKRIGLESKLHPTNLFFSG